MNIAWLKRKPTGSACRRAMVTGEGRRGFALILTVVLLSLLVLVLVMVASLTRVETSITGNTRKFSQARQNALLGLEKAIAQLQEAAGPDQRVTATAEILPGIPRENRHWTGVWRTDDGGSPPAPVWLVSGGAMPDTFDPESRVADGRVITDSADKVVLAGEDSIDQTVDEDNDGQPDEAVVVPLEEIRGEAPDGTPNVLLGRFGYWVGDEGVKARINLIDHRTVDADAYYAASADSQGGRLRHQAPQRTGTESVTGFGGIAANDPNLGKVLALEQADYVGAGTAARRGRFHDVTPHSNGLLVDVRNGGLKWDLTAFLRGDSSTDWLLTDEGGPREIAPALSAAGTASPTFGYLRAWWATGAGLSSFDSVLTPRPYEPPPAGGGYGVPGVHPILVRAGIRIGVHRTTPGGEGREDGVDTRHGIRPYIIPIFVLWNPFNVDLGPAEYRIRVLTQTGAQVTYTVDQTTQTDTLHPWPVPSEMVFEFPDATSGTGVSLRAGEAVVLSIADDGAASTANPAYWKPFVSDTPIPLDSKWRRHNAVFFDLGANPDYLYVRDPDGNPDRVTAAVSPPGGLIETIELQVANAGQWTTLQRVTDLPAVAAIGGQGRVMDDSDPARDAPWHRPVDYDGTLTVFNEDLIAQVWSFKTADLDPVKEAEVRPFADFNFLATELNGALTGGINPLWRALGGDEVENATGDDIFYTPYSPSGRDIDLARFGASLGSGGSIVNIFYEVPRAGSGPADETPLLSVGRFAHLRLTDALDEPVYAVGSSRAALAAGSVDYSFELNDVLWDQYFLSGIPADLTQADIDYPSYRLPFGRMRFVTRLGRLPDIDDLNADRVTRPAAFLQVEGMFNVNSTSVEAWRAVLSSYAGVPVANRVGTSEGNADHPFARFAFPDTAGYVSGDGKTDPTAWAGYRRLTSAEVDALAGAIVAELRERGAPFLSLGEFVNREPSSAVAARQSAGILERAIERAGINSEFDDPVLDGDGNVVGYQATNAPGYLTQADILMSLGGIFAVRSDTFLIRAYGDTVNPVTGRIEGRAWCEAVVQRVPEYVDTATDAWALPASGSVNERFGRRFRIVYFRWLSPDDI